MELHLTATECHLPYGITQYYLPRDTSEHTPQIGWHSIYLPRRDRRLSWRRWLVTYRGLPVSRQSPIQVVTGPNVEQLQIETIELTTAPRRHPIS